MESESRAREGFCEIRVMGKLEPSWSEWFDPLDIRSESGNTIISGFVADQPALQGLIEKISMLGLKVVSIRFAGPTEEKL